MPTPAVPEALHRVAPSLACPVCRAPMAAAPAAADGTPVPALVCARAHTVDVARQGHVTLTGGRRLAVHGDTAAMTDARQRVLAAGHYDAVAAALAELLPDAAAAPDHGGDGRTRLVVDLAGGTGQHLAGVLDRRPDLEGLSLDVSVYAARRAARAHPRLASAVCDVRADVPVQDRAAAAVLSVFGPRDPAEVSRMLAPGAPFLLVTPTTRHLRELVDALPLLSVDPRKDERLAERLGAFERTHRVRVTEQLRLSRQDVVDVAGMGPSAFHLSAQELAHVADGLPETSDATLSVDVTALRTR